MLVRGKTLLRTAPKALTVLHDKKIPFLLLTNGGGYHEEQRAEGLSAQLGVHIAAGQVLQSHTPFQDMQRYKDGNTLTVGGEYENARKVAQKYAH